MYCLHYFISYIAVKNKFFAKLVLGKPVPLILGEKILRHNMVKSSYQPVIPKDLNIQTIGGGMPTLLINDGRIVEENLMGLRYDKKWLKDQLLKKGITNIGDAYAAMIDSSGELYYSVNI